MSMLKSFQRIPKLVDKEWADNIFHILRTEIPWEFKSFGRGRGGAARPLPRMVYAYDDTNPNQTLDNLIDFIESRFRVQVFGAWLNLYRDGNDYTPYHRDSYGEMHAFTLSFGETRKFYLANDDARITYHLKHGDLFYFDPNINRRYKHTVPRETRVTKPRISVVFFTSAPGQISTTPLLPGEQVEQILNLITTLTRT